MIGHVSRTLKLMRLRMFPRGAERPLTIPKPLLPYNRRMLDERKQSARGAYCAAQRLPERGRAPPAQRRTRGSP